MVDIKQAAEWMLEGHLIKRKSKEFLIVYDYNKPEEEFGLNIDDLRANDWEINKRKFAPVKADYIMYIFANKKHKMSPGKLSKMVADGACFGALNTDKETVRQWIQQGFNKTIFEIMDEYQLKEIQHNLIKLGVESYIILDKDADVNTALGVQIVDKNKYKEFFDKYKLYKKVSLFDKIKEFFSKFKKKKDEYK